MTDIIETNTTEAPATSFHDNALQVPDNVAAAVSAAFTGNRLEQITHRATTWHDTVYATSNDMLYAILGECYGYYEDICRGGEPGKKLKEQLVTQFEKVVGKYNKDQHTLTSIVYCVFGYNSDKNRKRLSGYSIALRAALEDKQKSANISQYIKSKGGIEELRLGQKAGMSNAQKVEATKAAVANNRLANISDASATDNLDKAKTGQFVVLIAEQLANGELSVKATIEKQSIVDAVLASYYSTLSKQIEEKKQTQQTISNNDLIDEKANAAFEEAEEKLAA